MSVKLWLLLTAIMLTLFAVSGYVIAFHSKAVSQSPMATNVLLGVTAVSLFSWPVCLARAFQGYMKGRNRR